MREKPDFQLDRSFWLNPEYLPTVLVEDLRKILLKKTKIDAGQVEDFLQRCNTQAQFTKNSLVLNSKADTRDRLLLMAKKAADLLDG